MFEMITSEASYLRSLSVATSHFKGSLALRETLTRAEVHRLFSNLQQVKDVSESPGSEGSQGHSPGVFLASGPLTRPLSPARCRRENWRFRHVLRKLEEQPVCQRQPLKSFLVLPFQRITRLKILLEVRGRSQELGSHSGVGWGWPPKDPASEGHRLPWPASSKLQPKQNAGVTRGLVCRRRGVGTGRERGEGSVWVWGAGREGEGAVGRWWGWVGGREGEGSVGR
uniref:DH domain-containing protein n=1 Tax=Chrysemys picta bellii TaxID=8478 RepID=A0A8C3FUN4_CHRPI